MASVPACDVCGAVSLYAALPPTVQPCRWQTAVADYTGVLCDDCAATKSLAEIISHFEASPGGTVAGADRGPYLIVAEDEEGPALHTEDGAGPR